METSAFSELGLTGSEAKVMEFLVRQGPSTGTYVASRLDMQKSAAYFVLDKLVTKGLASFIIINDVKKYSSIEPEILDLKVSQRAKKFSNNLKMIKAVMESERTSKNRTIFRVYEGWDGMRKALDDIISRKDELLIFAVSISYDIFPRFRRFIRVFHSRRAKNGIKCKLLISEKHRSTLGSDRRKDELTEIRFVSPEHVMPMAVNVYGGRVLLAVWREVPLAVIIEGREFSQSFRGLFEMIWSKARK